MASSSGSSPIDLWLDALVARHTASLTMPEFLKAVRALSARYVESRGRLPDRSPIDSAGKRAAFAAFYAPLHFLTAREIARALRPSTTATGTILDLGCGTGVTSAAWALERDASSSIRGVDVHPWVLAEAQWNWRQLGLTGTARRGDLVDAAERLAANAKRPSPAFDPATVLLGWSVNELESSPRHGLLGALTRLAAGGVRIVVIEPIARSVSPWWEEWVAAFANVDPSSRADEWKFDLALPPALDRMNDAAGFSTRVLSARTIVSRP
jgi:predicted nicotinamide N-methyase